MTNVSSVLVQTLGMRPELFLQTMNTADRLNMPKLLACCERHVAIDPWGCMRTEDFWELMPACSSLRIARGLYAAYKKLHATPGSAGKFHPTHLPSENAYIELRFFVPPSKAFLKMAEAGRARPELSNSSLFELS